MPELHTSHSTPDPSISRADLNTNTKLPVCQHRWVGRIPYQEARQLQDNLASQVAQGAIPPTLLLLEHPHTYTIGRAGQQKNLLWDTQKLQQRRVSLHWIDRGGDITYHGPGQLVGYPLLPLGRPALQSGSSRIPQADYLGYLRSLELMLIRALTRFGLQGLQRPGKTGVWVVKQARPMKLASIGVKVDAQGISRHGFALNVAPDMSYWQGIVACGLPDDRMTSLEELLSAAPDMTEVCRAIIAAFGEQFRYSMVKYP